MSRWRWVGVSFVGVMGCSGAVSTDAVDASADTTPALETAPVDTSPPADTADAARPDTTPLPDTAVEVAPDAITDARPKVCPRGWWRAEHDARDAMKANDGVLSGAVTYETGKLGSAFGFDGSGGVVDIADSGTLTVTGSITVAAWVYLNARPAILAPVVSRWNDVGDVWRRGYALSITSAGAARWDVSTTGRYLTTSAPAATEANSDNAQVIATGAALTLARWTHLVGTFDAATGRVALYVDGVERSSIVAPFRMVLSPPEPVRIGKGFMTGNPLSTKAFIDEAMIFDRVLATDDVNALAGGGTLDCP